MTIENISEIITENQGVMIYFSGEKCGVCEALRPKIKEAFDTNFPNIKQIYINANEEKIVSSHFGIFSVPTILVYLESKEFIRKSRNLSIPLLVEELNRPYQIMNS